MRKRQVVCGYVMEIVGICVLSLLLVSCTQSDKGIETAVRNQLELYPEMTLQDLYKAFFQAELGPEHILADTTAAGEYLDYELMSTVNSQQSTENGETSSMSNVLYEPVGADSAFFRVHLCAVQQGKITRDELFSAFVDGALRDRMPNLDKWADKWKMIESVIKKMDLNLENYDKDKEMIGSILSSGNYAVHHSEKFNKLYHPHYRIVRKDIFMERFAKSLE